ncbi:MAG: hypothetical protein RLZZ58_1368 [Pseudomonadota bacterium]
MLTELNGETLAEAFSLEYRLEAVSAGNAVARLLTSRQWTERFDFNVKGQRVLLPARLHFASERLLLSDSDEAWLFARALQTRSNDGFARQRAALDLLADLRPWAAPFIVALIGEYIIEILDDISAALTPENVHTLAVFIVENAAYWDTTKRRVASYWNVYYRSKRSSETRRAYRRDEYIGFKIIDLLEMAAFV